MNQMSQQQGSQQMPQEAESEQGGLLEMKQTLTPEQIEMMKKGFQIAKNITYDKETFDSLMNESQQNSNPVEALAGLVVQVTMKLQEHFGKTDFPVLISLAIAIIQDLADSMNQTGKFQLGENEVTEALQLSIQMWLSANQGNYDPNEIQGLMRQLEGGA